ncbi:MAG: aminotransferase class V-fold PLP-dependent enzyme [Deltaproteobacteria bacterium]|nr:aminotransferase class V-fold PLP-dependent enzyme [Deltaproteobacteria bacterium]
MPLIYMDNAATSWPKPRVVIDAMMRFSRDIGANPGRSGHRQSIEAGRTIIEAREAVAELFSVSNPLRIIFTKNATEALNIALYGLLKPGDHVITSSIEHNSVMRPLRYLERQGIGLTCVACSTTGLLDPADVIASIRPDTRLITMTHASNVMGTIMPVREVGRIARSHGIPFLLDAAQTAGSIPIDVEDLSVDILACAGHKSLFGPQGTGILYVGKGMESIIAPIMRGGTGSRSESEEQPEGLPDRFEAGTLNTPGIAGLCAGVRFIVEEGIDRIRSHEEKLTEFMIESLASCEGVTVHGCGDAKRQTAVLSISLKGRSLSDAALVLDEEYGILTRPGLQCAPAAHRTMGTFPAGSIRLSPGYFTTEEDVAMTVRSLSAIAGD